MARPVEANVADFSAFLGAISTALRERDLPFMLIGGQAVLVHGQPRLTEWPSVMNWSVCRFPSPRRRT